MSKIAIRANQDRAGLGIALILAAWFCFSVVDTSVRWLLLAGLPAFQLAFMRYLGHFLISLWVLGHGGWDRERFRSSHFGVLILRAVLLVSSTLSNFIALNYLPLTVTSAIMFSSPIVICALSPWLLSERVGIWRWCAIALGFSGVLVVIRPFGAEFHWAMLLTIYNAVALALYSILTRKLSGLVAAETMQFYMGAVGTLALAPLGIWAWRTPSDMLDWGLLIGLGIVAWAGHEVLTRAHGYAQANTLSPYAYSFMIYLTLSSYVVWGDLPDFYTVVGALIIVVSGLVIWSRERKTVPFTR